MMRWSLMRTNIIQEYSRFIHASLKPATAFSRAQIVPLRRMVSTSTSNESKALLDQHNSDVAEISQVIKKYHAQGQKYRIQHGSTNSTRTARKGTNFVNLSQLNRVLHIDVASKTALVEPNVPMDRLVEATLPYGLVPPVVMEFPGITTGGGYAGTSGESSSFRHGFFDRTLDWVEIVLANGDVIRASESEHADLFRGAAGAVGSIGTTTLVQLRLKQAQPFVEVTYHPIHDGMEQAVALSKQLAQDPHVEYLDGIMYDKHQGVVVTGRGTSTVSNDTPVQRFSGRWDPYFYLHAKSRVANALNAQSSSSSSSAPTPQRDIVPLAEYLFRYDRGGFWVAPLAFDYFHMPYNRLTRFLLDDFLHTRMMYTALHSGGAGRDIVIQDLALPMDSRAAAFVDYTDREFGIYPLWLCPLRTTPGPAFHPHVKDAPLAAAEQVQDGGQLMMNIGLWGWAPRPARGGASAKEAYLALNRSLENKLAELGGMKWLYAKTFYSEDGFWRDHVGGGDQSRKWYDALRAKYHAAGLPSVWDKTHSDMGREWDANQGWRQALLNLWPVGGVYGLWKAIRSGTYKAARANVWRSFGRRLVVAVRRRMCDVGTYK